MPIVDETAETTPSNSPTRNRSRGRWSLIVGVALLIVAAAFVIGWSLSGEPRFSLINEILVAPDGKSVAIIGSRRSRARIMERIAEYSGYDIPSASLELKLTTVSFPGDSIGRTTSLGFTLPYVVAWSADAKYLL
jgi:hypothetical protein